MTLPPTAPAVPPPWIHRLLYRYARSGEHPSKRRLLVAARKIPGMSPLWAEVYPGVVMSLDYGDWIHDALYFHGEYESATLNRFDQLLQKARNFTDIGAHHGMFSLRAARQLAERKSPGRVYSFEPMPTNAARLINNARHSGLTNIDVFNMAVTDESAVVTMVTGSTANSGNTQVSNDVVENGLGVRANGVEFSTIQPILPEGALDVVKIDVEGLEARVLKSLFDAQSKPREILLEYFPDAFDYGQRDTIPKMLQQAGYKLQDVCGHDFSPDIPLTDNNLWASLQES